MYVCTKYVHFYVYVSQHGGPSEKDRGTSTLPYPTLTAGIGVGTLQYQYRSILPAPANVRLHLQYTSILRRVIYWYIYQVYIYIIIYYIPGIHTSDTKCFHHPLPSQAVAGAVLHIVHVSQSLLSSHFFGCIVRMTQLFFVKEVTNQPSAFNVPGCCPSCRDTKCDDAQIYG